MAEYYGDYIIVNIQNYIIKSNRNNVEGSFCEAFCLPVDPKRALKIRKKDGIVKYGFLGTIPFKIDKSQYMGTSALCKLSSNGDMSICLDEEVNVGYYVRCLNLAKVIDSYFPLCKEENDYKIIDVLSRRLNNMLSKRLVKVFESQKNKTVRAFGNRTLKNLQSRIDSHEDMVGLVKGIMQIDKEFYVEPEYKIVEDEYIIEQ